MVENVTAVFVDVPDAEHLGEAFAQVDAHPWDAGRIAEHAARYHEDVFIEAIRELVKTKLSGR
jgi:hypothetical protein